MIACLCYLHPARFALFWFLREGVGGVGGGVGGGVVGGGVKNDTLNPASLGGDAKEWEHLPRHLLFLAAHALPL